MMQALANHLLQSTVFAAVAWMVTLLLRNNHARTRYWVWFAASMKFFVPFAWFVEMGRRMSVSVAPVTIAPRVALVADVVRQSFSVGQTMVPPSAVTDHATSILPAVLLAVWMCGGAGILMFWLLRWCRIAALLRTAKAWDRGRDLGIATVVLQTRMEPCVFGVVRPVLCLPAGIVEHLDDIHLDAVVTHELCHVRRRDNLTATLHMLVEAVFWFHPLVWWIGARLVAERERACDEEVVWLGGDPEVYAESILKICRMYLESPLACAAGISGADLAKRIEQIMRNPGLKNLSMPKRVLMGGMAVAAFVLPVTVGLLSAPAIRAQVQRAIAPKPTGPVAQAAPALQLPPAPRQELMAAAPDAASPAGTWADSRTGLTWAGADNGSDVSQVQAGEYCASLQLGNLREWRLPTIEEVRSIYATPDFEGRWSTPFSNDGGQAQAGTNGVNRILGGIHLTEIAGQAWTSSGGRVDGEAWYFLFAHGVQYSANVDLPRGRALCVRGTGVKVARTAEADGPTWTDTSTRLMWARKDNGAPIGQAGAKEYCSALGLAGFRDWRLPAIEELAGIYDPSFYEKTEAANYYAAIRGGLQLSTGFAWSGTQGTNSGEAWMFGFQMAYRFSRPVDEGINARALCVRRAGP